MEIEIWKDLKNYEGYYQVSNLGRIKSLHKRSNRILVGGVTPDGYCQVNTSINGKTKSIKIHQMVAIAFLNHTPSKGIVVDHINGDLKNNSVDNLRVVTSRYNNTFGFRKDRDRVSSKYPGVSFDCKRKKWSASIQINLKNKRIGFFENEIDAFDAYKKKLLEI